MNISGLDNDSLSIFKKLRAERFNKWYFTSASEEEKSLYYS